MSRQWLVGCMACLVWSGGVGAEGVGRVWLQPLRGQPVSFVVEIASTEEEISKGLMFRQALAADQGMLFLYPESAPRYFWMKNVVLPLDILFIDRGRIRTIHQATPCKADPCPVYSSAGKAAQVLEIAGGLARKLNLAPGSPVWWELPQE